jgi:hypothetical protein
MPFDFISRESRELLVTIGDSWTWGDDITASNNDTIRLAKVFGNLISTTINSDWINLGQCGSGNFWLANKVKELAAIIPELHYEKIYVICTLTEVGREFNSTYDRNIDYINWLVAHNPRNDLLGFLNNLVVTEIIDALKSFPNVVLKIGTNFVNHIGLGTAQPYLLDTPWINLLTNVDDNCYVVGSYTIDNFRRSIDLFPNHELLLCWLVELTELSKKRNMLLQDKNKFRNGHPLQSGHQQWANYIIQSL